MTVLPNDFASTATVIHSSPDDPLAAPLVEELSREYDERYGLNDGIPSSAELSRYPAELFHVSTGGVFLLLLVDGRPSPVEPSCAMTTTRSR